MNKQYTYIENQYPARPRSKRRRKQEKVLAVVATQLLSLVAESTMEGQVVLQVIAY